MSDPASTIPDERLRLIFACCHPALAAEEQVALALDTLGDLTTGEIARAFLAPEPTLRRRLSRASRTIGSARLPYEAPPDHLLPERLPAVLMVIYLIYSEGYAATAGATLLRPEVSAEAIRLGRVLAVSMPDEAEVLGLLGLMLLQDSRRAARVAADGGIILLEEQDRSLWDRAQIGEGRAFLERALRMRRPGTYQIQAAIAAVHAEARRAAETDWRQIALLYGELARLNPSPVIDLNRAVAVGMADGPEAGLALLEQLHLGDELSGYHLFHATQADLLRRAGHCLAAADCYSKALGLASNVAERAFLRRRLAEVTAT